MYTSLNCMRCEGLFGFVNTEVKKSVTCTNSPSFLCALDNPSTVGALLQQLMALDFDSSFTFVRCPGLKR